MKKPKKIVLLDIDDTLFNTDTFKRSHLTSYELYEEVVEALSELTKIATLGIFSQGEIAFQNKKLQMTNIDTYFVEEHTHIVEDKIQAVEEILYKYAGKGTFFFIDDRLQNLQMAKQKVPTVVTIWMKRGRYAKEQALHSDFRPDMIVTNLHEAVPFIAQS